MYEHSSLETSQCFECEPEVAKTNVLRNYATGFYKLIGERHQFLIHTAYGKSKHIFSPYTSNGESIITRSR